MSATFWEYDTRLGRRWNIDNIYKSWQSNYVCFSNNPINKIDPNGDDDFFNKDGTYSHSKGKGTSIYVQTDKGNVLFIKVVTNTMSNRFVLAGVTLYYANQVGITGKVGVGNSTKSVQDGTLAFTFGEEIYVNVKGGGASSMLNNYNNLKSVLEHEKDHKAKGHGHNQSSNLEHAGVYLNQVKDKSFGKTSTDFKEGMVGSICNYMSAAAQEVGGSGGSGNFNQINDMISQLNSQSKKTGYTFRLVQTQEGGMNPELDKYEVRASKVKKTDKK